MLIILSIVFILILAFDFLSARMLKMKRGIIRNCSTGVIVILCAVCLTLGIIESAGKSGSSQKAIFNAYNYIIDENSDRALEEVKNVESPHRDVIGLLVDCQKDNYNYAFINSDDLLNSGRLDKKLSEQVELIKKLAHNMAGIDETPKSSEEARQTQISIANNCIDILELSSSVEMEFRTDLRVEKMIDNNDFDSISPEVLKNMLKEQPNNTNLLRYSIKYYNNKDMKLAEEMAKELFEKDSSAENAVLYADVLAEKYNIDKNNNNFSDEDKADPEIGNYLAQAEEIEKSLWALNPGSNEYTRASKQAAEFREKAANVKLNRLINWIKHKIPIGGDKSGLLYLQISRIYTSTDDEDKARESLMTLIKNKDKISDDSQIKDAVKDLSIAIASPEISDEEISGIIDRVCSAGAFLPDSYVRRSYSTLLNKVLKYERVSIFISSIDASDYPTVRAYLNVNGRAQGEDTLADEFDAADFIFRDNGSRIPSNKIKRVIDNNNRNISIALVIDCSGSMGGSPTENARKAVEACINNMNGNSQMLSIVTYESSGRIAVPLTNDKISLQNGVSNIYAGGGTNISAGIYSGLESLKSAAGTKAIILMTDGQDGNSGIEEAIKSANEQSVAIYTVALGDADTEYMKNISDKTGGSFMSADSDNDLSSIYTALQSFIVNNYCFEYTVENDIDANPRIMSVTLDEYKVTNSRRYSYNGLVSDGNAFITKVNDDSIFLTYAEPSKISASDAKSGVPIFVDGQGISEGTKLFINEQEINNVHIINQNTLSFVLEGDYAPGVLNIAVQNSSGSTYSTDSLISISQNTANKTSGKTIKFGQSGCYIYASNVQQNGYNSLILSGNVVLNGFIGFTDTVYIYSDSELSAESAQIIINNATISSSGSAYITYSPTNQNGYLMQSLKNGYVNILSGFSMRFNGTGFSTEYSNSGTYIPGIGNLSGDAEITFDAVTVTAQVNYGGVYANEISDNLNYAINGIPIPKTEFEESSFNVIIGGNNKYPENYNNKMSVNISTFMAIFTKNSISIKASGYVEGYIGGIKLGNAIINIDNDSDGMFTIEGGAKVPCIENASSGYYEYNDGTFKITSNGTYPERLVINSKELKVDSDNISKVFTENTAPEPFDGSINITCDLETDDEPYADKINELIDSTNAKCDKISFESSGDLDDCTICAFDSSNPSKRYVISRRFVKVPIAEVDELSMFGSKLGGEITGTVSTNNSGIIMDIDVDGHLDNTVYGIKYDGKSHFTVQLPKNSYAGGLVNVTLSYGESTLNYSASLTGSVYFGDGFHEYIGG